MTFRRVLRRFLHNTTILFVDVEKRKTQKMFFRRAARPNVPPELTLTRRTKSIFHRVARGMLRKVKKGAFLNSQNRLFTAWRGESIPTFRKHVSKTLISLVFYDEIYEKQKKIWKTLVFLNHSCFTTKLSKYLKILRMVRRF